MTFPTQGAKLTLAAWLETHSDFRLPAHASDVKTALMTLDTSPSPVSYSAQFATLKRYFNRAVLVLMVCCALLGFMAVPSAFAMNQANQVNIFWLFLVLLGFHGLNVIVWLITMVATSKRPSDSKGVLLTLLIFLNKKISKYSHFNDAVSAAYLHWQCPPHSNKWLISSLSHGAWGCYLLAGWVMTLLLLLTNQVNFAWETTLLSDAAFIQLTQTLSVIPQWFGIALPNQLDILASRVDLIQQSASTRQHWANFLLASILIYGVLPRLIFTLICVALYQITRKAHPLSTQEQIIQNRYRQPEQQSRLVLDADAYPKTLGTHNTNAKNDVLSNQAFSQQWALFEWSGEKPSQLQPVGSAVMLNSREEQARFLASPSHEAMFLLVDANQSPDRGTRRFLNQARAVHSALTLVIYQDTNSQFHDDWYRLARETNIPSNTLPKEE